MESSYKLVYFDLRGLGEPIRLLFHYLNIPFEDCRFDPHQWESVKKTIKWHQLPELYVKRGSDGKTICLTQATAICRFLANSNPEFKLMPQDPLEIARCDEIVSIVQDLRLKVKPYLVNKLYGSEEDRKNVQDLKKQLYENDFELHLKNLEEILRNLRNEFPSALGNFILGVNPSWADFFLANFTEMWEQVLENDKLLDPYPMMKKQQEEVYNITKIKIWLDKRPKTKC